MDEEPLPSVRPFGSAASGQLHKNRAVRFSFLFPPFSDLIGLDSWSSPLFPPRVEYPSHSFRYGAFSSYRPLQCLLGPSGRDRIETCQYRVSRQHQKKPGTEGRTREDCNRGTRQGARREAATITNTSSASGASTREKGRSLHRAKCRPKWQNISKVYKSMLMFDAVSHIGSLLINDSHSDQLPIYQRASPRPSQLRRNPLCFSRSLHLPEMIRRDGPAPSSQSCVRANTPIPNMSPSLPPSFRAPTAPDQTPFPPCQSNSPRPALGNAGSCESSLIGRRIVQNLPMSIPRWRVPRLAFGSDRDV